MTSSKLETLILQMADDMDHPNHYQDAEHAEVCKDCNWGGWQRSYWPCNKRIMAERLRGVVEQARSETETES